MEKIPTVPDQFRIYHKSCINGESLLLKLTQKIGMDPFHYLGTNPVPKLAYHTVVR
ncbi:MAG: hypothetical protein ACLQDF_08870 [Desulfomonilia bacterium]